VWLPGGAFSFGSANTGRTAGDRIALAHDVVLVSVNHRLNAFGHLFLAEVGGSDFADSGNVGILDLVLALNWVRDNIAAFGGDPSNVTIFGVSGGGGKVSTLQAMPLARGLFHRAVVQSGAAVKLVEKAKAARLAEALMRELGIARNEFRKPQSVPVAKLLSAERCRHQAVRLRAQSISPRCRRPLAATPSVRSRRAGYFGRHSADDRRYQRGNVVLSYRR